MDRKPRVLQICHDFKGPFRTVARQYAECFVDCEIKTIFLRGEKSSDIAGSIPGEVDFLMLGPGALRGLKLDVVANVAAIIADQVPDILIAHRYKPFFVALLLRRKMDIPLVLGVMHEYGFLGRPSRSVLTRFWPDNVHLIGVSEAVCKEVRLQLPHLYFRVHQVPHAMEDLKLLGSATARQRLGIPSGRYCFGVIGRLVSKKNHELLIRAFAELGEDSVLAVVGDGVLKDDLKELTERLGIEHRVTFSGYQENARTLMKAFDAFVLPSGIEEAFGMVLLEAMAASIPILSTDAPGPKSVVGDAAITFKCDDKVDLVAKLKRMQALSKQEAGELVARGSRRLQENFSVAAMSEKIRSVPEIARLAPTGVERDV